VQAAARAVAILAAEVQRLMAWPEYWAFSRSRNAGIRSKEQAMKYFEERRTTTLRYTWYGAAVTKIFSLFG
jgi:hypothetical protein